MDELRHQKNKCYEQSRTQITFMKAEVVGMTLYVRERIL